MPYQLHFVKLKRTLMRISSSGLSLSCSLSVRDRNRILSRASAALEMSSRRKISCSSRQKSHNLEAPAPLCLLCCQAAPFLMHS